MKRHLILLCCLVTAIAAWAQDLTVKGTVLSAADNEPLIGATVMLKGSPAKASVTDIDGRFTLTGIPSDGTLVFSYVGFKNTEIALKGRTEIDIALEENTSVLDEVVVVGYGVVKRSDLTSSISTVKGDAITEVTTGNAMDALQGKVSGVQIASGGGPGASPKVMIRGITSVNGSSPLYVVDGVPLNTGDINFINNNDIESMEVLKDASASAIYGTRASNGVIIITTKKGAAGKTSVDFSASVGFQNIPKPKMAWADEYEKVFKQRYINDNRTPIWNSPYWNYGEVDGTDWWEEVVNDIALVQNYSLGVRGGNDKFIYSLSLGYFRNNSQFDYGYWDKINVRLNTEYNFSRWLKAGLDIAPTLESWDNSPELFDGAMSMDPTTPIFRPEEEWDPYNPMSNYQRSYNSQVWNPAASLARMDNHTSKLNVMMNPYIQIMPIRQLVFRTQFGVNGGYQRNDWYNCAFRIDALEMNKKNTVGRNYSDGINWTWNNTLTYMDTFAEKHNLTVMGGFTAERYADWWANASRNWVVPGEENSENEDPNKVGQAINGLLHEVSAANGTQFASGAQGAQTLASFLGRLMYNFDSRYYLTASVRADGSSRFPKGNKYGVFPSASLAWRLSEEAFMEETRNWLDNAKVRLGWGRVGNQAIGNGAYMSMLNSGVNYVFGTTPSRYPSTIVGTIGNPNLKWETVEDIDFGLDLSFLNSRLNVTMDLYRKTSHDMLYDKQSMLLLGVPRWQGAITQNIGKMRAQGWELSVDYRDNVGDFRYNVGVQLSGVRNKAIKFTGDGPIWTAANQLAESIIKNEDGELISQFFGYHCGGIFQTWEQVYNHTDEHGAMLQPDAQPGDLIFLDLNHDGVLDEKDKTYIGNPYPKMQLGLNMNFEYRNFDLTANFFGSFGNDIFNLQRRRYSGGGGANVFRGTLGKTWSEDNTGAEYPRLSYNDLNMNYSRVSDFFVEDGSYFRCKLLTLGYTLPESIMRGCKLRFYVSAQNVFTITRYTGMDPERPLYDGGCLETGIDHCKYPTPRTFIVGLDFKL